MALNSMTFGVFLVLVMAGLFRLPKKYQWVWLLFLSYGFYAWFGLGYAGLLATATLINYAAGIWLEEYPKQKKTILATTVGLNLAILAVFKYLGFLETSLEEALGLLGISLELPKVKLALPVGISFYTFTTIGYLADVYRGKIKAQRHLGHLALFVAFFPKMIAGPIERAGDLLPQFKQAKTVVPERLASGMRLFALGLFKKMVIADNLAMTVNRVFGNLEEYKGLSLVILMVLYSWQIYADFSGYTDMARGAARMLGFKLVENFRKPYAATSVRDFWRRWHLSLSNWIRDYMYIPLGGSRKGLRRTVVNYLVVFGLCGLWHGAAWTFVVWGLFHGVVLAGERVAGKIMPAIKWPKVVKMIYAYAVVSMAWVYFRAESLEQAGYIFRYALVGISNFVSPNYVWATISQLFVTNRLEMGIALFALVSAVGIDWLRENQIARKWFFNQRPWVRTVIYAVMVLLIVQLRDAQIKEFIYVRF